MSEKLRSIYPYEAIADDTAMNIVLIFAFSNKVYQINSTSVSRVYFECGSMYAISAEYCRYKLLIPFTIFVAAIKFVPIYFNNINTLERSAKCVYKQLGPVIKTGGCSNVI
jgi:hypothetical protein